MKSIFGSPEPGDSIAAQPEHQMSVVLGAESREMPWNTYYIYPTIGIIHPKTTGSTDLNHVYWQGLLRQLVTRLSMCISSQGLAVHQLRCVEPLGASINAGMVMGYETWHTLW